MAADVVGQAAVAYEMVAGTLEYDDPAAFNERRSRQPLARRRPRLLPDTGNLFMKFLRVFSCP